MDSISTARLAPVHPELARRVTGLIDELANDPDPVNIRVTRGIATVEQQDALWQIGRDADGNKIGATVTNAKGTQSNHVLGFAVDVVPMNINTGQPDWNLSHKDWQRIIALAPKYGLRDGQCFHDAPHLELIEVPEVPTEEMQQTYLQAGAPSLWAETTIPTAVWDTPGISA
jgi:hypothetical protein